MNMRPVNSSNVARIGYDPARRVLRAQYKSGSTHDYDGVPPDVYAELMDGRSVGGYLASEIKPRFAGSKVEESPQPIRDTGSARVSDGPQPTAGPEYLAGPETSADTLDGAIRRFNASPQRP